MTRYRGEIPEAGGPRGGLPGSERRCFTGVTILEISFTVQISRRPVLGP